MRRLLLVGCMAWAICLGAPLLRTRADDVKPATDQTQKDQTKDQDKDKSKDQAKNQEKSAADKATLVDKILGVIEGEKPADGSQNPAEAAKPNAVEKEKSKTEKPQETKRKPRRKSRKRTSFALRSAANIPKRKAAPA